MSYECNLDLRHVSFFKFAKVFVYDLVSYMCNWHVIIYDVWKVNTDICICAMCAYSSNAEGCWHCHTMYLHVLLVLPIHACVLVSL